MTINSPEFEVWLSKQFVLRCPKCSGSGHNFKWQSDPAGGRGEYIHYGQCITCKGTGLGTREQYFAIWKNEQEHAKIKIENTRKKEEALAKLTIEDRSILGLE